jgi:hypothetical protein
MEMNMSFFIITLLILAVVSFIAGYGIIRFIDNKLSSVVVNVPQQDYKLPPIYLTIDKDSNIKKIKLNDVVSTKNTENEMIIDNESSDSDDYDDYTNMTSYDFDEDNFDQSPNSVEKFGSLEENPTYYNQSKQSFLGGQISKKNKKTDPDFYTEQDPNFNLLTNIPLLVSPDIVSPNMKTEDSFPYYSNRAKLVDKKDSQLVKLQNMYLNKIKNTTKKAKEKRTRDLVTENFINGPFDGYNSHVNLKEDSYGNVTSIGKSLLTPYTSYPIPS